MKSILGVSLLILLVPGAYAAELPGDSDEGKRLHDANCMSCHDTGIYTRKDRLVQSLAALKKRLSDCSHMANKEFSAIETQSSSSTSMISFISSARASSSVSPLAVQHRAYRRGVALQG